MQNTDGTPTDDKTNPKNPEKEEKEEIEVKVESETDDEVNTDVEGSGEDTPAKNEPSKPSSPDDKRSAGNVIAGLGNEKKALATKLVSLAKVSENSRQEVKKMLIEDPSTASYLKTKFGDDYDLIVGEEPIKKDNEVDVEKIKEQARTQAEAEAIKSQMQASHEQMLLQKAKQLGFNAEELELYKTKVEVLGGDEKAIEDAALIVNYKKTTAKKGEFATEDKEAAEPKKKTVTITPALNDFAESSHVDKKEFASDIHKVKGLHRTDAHGKSVMDLPKL